MTKKTHKIILIYSTTGSYEEAQNIALSLLEKKLAACVNILPNMLSIYRWKGVIEKSPEYILIAKTRHQYAKEVIKTIQELHSYELPCVLNIPVDGGFQAYLDYIINETEITDTP